MKTLRTIEIISSGKSSKLNINVTGYDNIQKQQKQYSYKQ